MWKATVPVGDARAGEYLGLTSSARLTIGSFVGLMLVLAQEKE
jgi:hypothetical protein